MPAMGREGWIHRGGKHHRLVLAAVVIAGAIGALPAQRMHIDRRTLDEIGHGGLSAAAPPEFHLAAVPNLSAGTVSILDTTLEQVVATMPFGPSPRYAAASPDGHWFYVAGTGSSGNGRIERIDIQRRTVVSQIDLPVNGEIGELEVSPDGRYVVATSNQPPTIYVFDAYLIDTAALTLVTTLAPSAGNALAPEVTFDAESRFLYAAANSGITTIELASHREVYVSPLPVGELYTDIETLPGVPRLVFATSLFSLDVHSTAPPAAGTPPSGQLQPFPLARDVAGFSFGNEHFLAYGGNGFPAAMHVYHLNSGATMEAPSTAMVLQSLRFDASRLELWAISPSTLFERPSIRVFDLVHLRERAMLETPGPQVFYPLYGVPSFTPDYLRFYAPDPVRNKVTVVDVPGLFVRGEIAVGTSPTVIVMQGDTRTREAY